VKRLLAAMLFWLSLIPLVAAAEQSTSVRSWTDLRGNEIQARIVAADLLRVILRSDEDQTFVVSLSDLTSPDRDYARAWRKHYPETPLADAAFPYRWAEEASGAETAIEPISRKAGEGYAYRSEHYQILSDIDLPKSVAREFLKVFEATRAAVIASPLGLIDGMREEPYTVWLFGNPRAYHAAGGPPGSGGLYSRYRDRLIILLPNLGIDPENPSIGFDYRERLYVLKHEAVHQLVPDWAWQMPYWLNEGLSECFASIPYSHGRYRFRDFDRALFRYLQKYRRSDDQPLVVIEPETLMQSTPKSWLSLVEVGSAYTHYNSAALLTHYFLHHDGEGNGAGLIGLFAAIRAGEPVAQAVEQHLIRGRSPEQIKQELETIIEQQLLDYRWQ